MDQAQEDPIGHKLKESAAAAPQYGYTQAWPGVEGVELISKLMHEHKNPRAVEKDVQFRGSFTKRQVKRDLQARIQRKNKNKMKTPIARLSTSKEVAPKGFTQLTQGCQDLAELSIHPRLKAKE